jgi:hypothetical protein
MGSSATRVANLAALVFAFLIVVESSYIEHRHWGYVLPSDTFLGFFPAIVMFVVRSEPFSFAFLLSYVFISIRLAFVVHGAYAGVDQITKGNNPLFILVLFCMITVVCLTAYVIGALVKLIASHFSSRNHPQDQVLRVAEAETRALPSAGRGVK